MENTPYQAKAIKILEERTRKAKADHKAKKEAKKAMTAKMRPIKKAIKDAEKRIFVLQGRIDNNKLQLLEIRCEYEK